MLDKSKQTVNKMDYLIIVLAIACAIGIIYLVDRKHQKRMQEAHDQGVRLRMAKEACCAVDFGCLMQNVERVKHLLEKDNLKYSEWMTARRYITSCRQDIRYLRDENFQLDILSELEVDLDAYEKASEGIKFTEKEGS